MKTSLKFIVVLTCIYFTVTAFVRKAENSNAPFVGIWELSAMASNGQDLQKSYPGHLKIFNADGTYTVVQVQNTGSVIKGKGHFAIDNDQTYREADKAEDLASQGFKINYEFSADKKTLTVGYTYKDGAGFTEAYRKL